jgi:hypothetical protein
MAKKTEKVTVETNGFTVKIDPSVLETMDYVDAAADAYNPDNSEGDRLVATTTLIRTLFGDEYKAVKAHFVTAEAVTAYFRAVTEQIAALKN